MSPSRRRRSESEPNENRPSEASSGSEPGGSPAPSQAPRFLHYIYLNLVAWLLLAIQAVLLSRALGSGRTVILFSTFLGLGLLIVSIFDYLWLRSRR